MNEEILALIKGEAQLIVVNENLFLQLRLQFQRSLYNGPWIII